VTRPGRCGATVSFEAFNRAEADEWLGGERGEALTRDRISLAELLAIRDGQQLPEPRAPLGFITPHRS
jgi:hypothetical protein